MSAESTLGAYLRRCRERSGLSPEAVSSGSRIVLPFVRALEGDRHDLLPAPVYVRGFIRAYCGQVGVDAEAALRRYDAHVAAIPAPPLRPRPPAPAPPPPARRWRPAVAGGLLLVALGMGGTLLLWRGRQPDAVAARGPASGTSPSSAPAPPLASAAPAPPDTSAAPLVVAAPTPSAAPIAPGILPAPAASSPAVPAAIPASSAASPAPATPERVLLVRAVDTAWVRVTPEGAPPSEEMLPPGAVREWRSAGRFRITLGNAGGVELQLDGRPLPALGQRGQVVHATIPDEPRP